MHSCLVQWEGASGFMSDGEAPDLRLSLAEEVAEDATRLRNSGKRPRSPAHHSARPAAHATLNVRRRSADAIDARHQSRVWRQRWTVARHPWRIGGTSAAVDARGARALRTRRARRTARRGDTARAAPSVARGAEATEPGLRQDRPRPFAGTAHARAGTRRRGAQHLDLFHCQASLCHRPWIADVHAARAAPGRASRSAHDPAGPTRRRAPAGTTTAARRLSTGPRIRCATCASHDSAASGAPAGVLLRADGRGAAALGRTRQKQGTEAQSLRCESTEPGPFGTHHAGNTSKRCAVGPSLRIAPHGVTGARTRRVQRSFVLMIVLPSFTMISRAGTEHSTCIQAATHAGFDRVVFEFHGAVPGYHREYVDRPTPDCGRWRTGEGGGQRLISPSAPRPFTLSAPCDRACSSGSKLRPRCEQSGELSSAA
jgi:hypothetical protein